LQGFRRVHLRAGEARTVSFTLRREQMAMVDAKGKRFVEPGLFRVSVGGRQPRADEGRTFEVIGTRFAVP
jgi:beta-glucosidase